ncbi:MAG: glycosyltransferase [Chitinophagaceae bacterium]|nr:glycosyltransferase [Chitinophagaceae bacterium]
MIKVTLITVTLNSEKFLEDAIQSVMAQDYPNIEHIIIDGESTDGTLNIISKYNGHIAKWVSEKDYSMYDAINKGMKMATGDIIGTLNSDDMLASPDVISKIVQCFETKKVDAVYGDLLYVEQDDISKVLRKWKGGEFKRRNFRYGWMPAHPTFYFRSSLLETCGYYETHFFTAADYEFMTRYLYYYKVSAAYVGKLIVRMRNGGMSNSNIFSRLRANRRDYLAMKKNRVPMPFVVSFLKPLIKLHQYTNMGLVRFFT